MKKENLELKELIKEAILEAFAEMYGVSTADAVIPEAPGEGDGEASDGSGEAGEGSEGNSNNGGGSNSAANSGGTPNNGRPKPDVGVGVFGLR